MNKLSLNDYITKIPKVELHLHIEGTLEPELLFQIAKRNNIKLKYNSIEELKSAYNFNNLQEFLDLYYQGANVLQQEQDFYDLTFAYLKNIHGENVVHTEIFFDPQTHTDRGITFDTVICGIKRALDDGEMQFGISSKLIMCFLRHLSEESASSTLNQAMPYLDWITAVGLDSSEVGNPPSKFKNVFEKAHQLGLIAVAHAGEEGPSDYIWDALNLLKVKRIDHGNRCVDDDKLVETIAESGIPLTLCPLSNLSLKIVSKLEDHPLLKLLENGIVATINSDDPAYFGGYITKNFIEISKALNLSKVHINKLVENSIAASFLSYAEKTEATKKLTEFNRLFLNT